MRAIGIILAGGSNGRMQNLTDKRAVAAMRVAGSFRSIDFALSNMTNSHIKKVAVLTQYNSVSLNEHLSSSKWWDFGRKQGGLYIFTPTITYDNCHWYQGTADAIYQNIDFLKESHEPYVVIASGDGIYKLNYDKLLEYHIDKKADITVVCHNLPEGEDAGRFGQVKTDAYGRITEFAEKPLTRTSNLVSTGIYVIRRRLLIELLEINAREGRNDFVQDILIRYKDRKHIYCYKLDTYWRSISSVDAYYNANMDFLKPEVRKFFREYPGIYSKVEDLPPAKYNPNANVKNSLISSGSIINGTVENSVLFKNVFVGSNCVIRDAIILNDVYIADDAIVEHCIVESGSTIKAGRIYRSDEEGIRVFRSGTKSTARYDA